MIIYFVWAIILTVHRDTVVNKSATPTYTPTTTTVMNPVQMQDVRVNDDEEI
jgi:hypothetical protein